MEHDTMLEMEHDGAGDPGVEGAVGDRNPRHPYLHARPHRADDRKHQRSARDSERHHGYSVTDFTVESLPDTPPNSTLLQMAPHPGATQITRTAAQNRAELGTALNAGSAANLAHASAKARSARSGQWDTRRRANSQVQLPKPAPQPERQAEDDQPTPPDRV